MRVGKGTDALHALDAVKADLVINAPEHVKGMRARGVAACISKPFDLSAVVAYVKKLAPLRGRRLARNV